MTAGRIAKREEEEITPWPSPGLIPRIKVELVEVGMNKNRNEKGQLLKGNGRGEGAAIN